MKRRNNSFSVALLFSVLVAMAAPLTPAWAADLAGTVFGIKGDVRARTDSGDRILLKGDSIFVGETLLTGANSYLVVSFIDGAKATMRPDSELAIERYASGEGDNGALLGLVKGGLRAVTGAIAQRDPDSYQVRTPVATLGVRGTEYYLRICEQDCAAEQRMYVQNMVEQETF
jgi:hypothetical protein